MNIRAPSRAGTSCWPSRIPVQAWTRRLSAQVFEPFFTTKERDKGTGLGLATVYGVVKQSDGYIAVESQKGNGSSFKVYLPLVRQAAVAQESVPAPRSVRGCETILLVEDAEALRKLAHMFLRDNGYDVLTAEDGSEAMRIAQQSSAPIHLLLTDVVMPGMNGRVLAERLAPGNPAMKVLYMSGYTDTFIAGHGALEPGTHLLQKPFTEETLTRKVREVLDGARNVTTLESAGPSEDRLPVGSKPDLRG